MIRNAAKIASWTLVSRLSGFARDVVIATFIGAGGLADSFFLALMLPNSFRRFFAEGAFNAAFLPQFAALQKKNQGAAYLAMILGLLMSVLGLLVVLFEGFAPQIVSLCAPGFSATPERFLWTVQMARIMFPYIFLVAVANVLGGVLQSFGRFSLAAAVQALFNLSMIGTFFLLTPFLENPVMGLAIGVIVSGVLQLAILWWRAVSWMPIRVTLPKRSPILVTFLRKFTAASLGLGMIQLMTFLNGIFASLLAPGSLSLLFYADRLVQFPLSMIGLALSTALLPELSKAVHEGNGPEILRLQTRAFQAALFLSLPAACGLFILAPQMVEVLFQRGAFTPHDTQITAQILQAAAIGLPSYVLGKIFSTCFFANGDTRTPALCSLVFLAVYLLSIWTVQGLWGPAGITLSLSLGSWANTFCLGGMLWKRGICRIDQAILRYGLKTALACAGMGIFLSHPLEILRVPFGAGWIQKTLDLGGLILLGSLVFFGIATLLKLIRKL